jgi:hypothetical protein
MHVALIKLAVRIFAGYHTTLDESKDVLNE